MYNITKFTRDNKILHTYIYILFIIFFMSYVRFACVMFRHFPHTRTSSLQRYTSLQRYRYIHAYALFFLIKIYYVFIMRQSPLLYARSSLVLFELDRPCLVWIVRGARANVVVRRGPGKILISVINFGICVLVNSFEFRENNVRDCRKEKKKKKDQ